MLHAFLLLTPLALAGDPVQATETPPDPSGSADRTLLDALLVFLSEQTGERGAELLGQIEDPRASAPLIHGALTRGDTVAVAATRALSQHPEALPTLAGWLTAIDVRVAVRVEAARSLGALQMAPAADALVQALDDGSLPRDLRSAILETIRLSYPDRAPEVAGQVVQSGTMWLMLGGSTALGYTLATAGHFGQTQLETPGALTGAVAGGTLGYVAGRSWPMEAGDAAYVATSGMMGTVGGILLADALGDGNGDAGWLGGLGGEVLGYGVSFATRDIQRGTQADAGEAVGVAWFLALTLGSGAATVVVNQHRYPSHVPKAFTGPGVLLGGAAGHLVAPHVDLQGVDKQVMALSSTYGMALGGLVPIGNLAREGLPATGLGVGYLAGYGMANWVDTRGKVILGGFTGMGYGMAVGVGAGRLMGQPWSYEPQVIQGSTLVGGTLGMGVGLSLAALNPNPVQPNDVVFTGIATGWALWQSVGWGAVLDTTERATGWMGVVPGVIGGGSAIVSPFVRIGVGDTLCATSLGLWGSYGGAVAAILADASDPLEWSLVASDLGLGAGVLLMSPVVDASPVVVGLADAGGVLGSSTAALGAAFVTSKEDPILVASLVGAGVGALGGGLLGARLDGKVLGHREARLQLPYLPHVHVPGQWSVQPAAFVADGATVWGASISGQGW